MSRPTRIAVLAACGLAGLLFAGLGYARFATVHNETFDLAFYARMAWGPPHIDVWEPIVNACVLGVHVSPVMIPLGVLSLVFGAVNVLLVAQAAAAALAAWPLARFGYRRLGNPGALLGTAAWLLYPNIGHVTTYEFHPGTLAVLPLGWALDAYDRGHARHLWWAVLGVLACREDLALVTFMLGWMAWRAGPILQPIGKRIMVASVGWFLLFVLVLHPIWRPTEGSMQLHFARFGDTVPEALLGVLLHPGTLLAHLAETPRLLYLPALLLPLLFLPVLRPRWFLLVAPVLAINLLSSWPTTMDLNSHYQTILLPVLIVAALDALSGFGRWEIVAVPLVAALIAAHLLVGGTPVSTDFDASAFRQDARSRNAARAIAAIPAGASVQAPYALMAHLAERELITRLPPPERVTDYVIFDLWHRRRFERSEHLLRTTEEPVVRSWLGRADHGVVLTAGRYVVLQRGADPRAAAAPYLVDAPPASEGQSIAACLSVLGATLDPEHLTLDLVAHGPCPTDLAIRIGTTRRPHRVDLLFDGILSPAHLRDGDHLRSMHTLTPGEHRAIREQRLRIGALRSSGPAPEHGDPAAVTVPVVLARPGPISKDSQMDARRHGMSALARSEAPVVVAQGMSMKRASRHGKAFNPETLALGYGYDPFRSEGALKPPVFLTSTFEFASAAEGKRFFELAYSLREREPGEIPGLIYSRINNPNLQIFEERMAAWDRTDRGACFASGMAAISTTLLAVLEPGDHVLSSAPVYGGTHYLFEHVLPRFGIQVTQVRAGGDTAQLMGKAADEVGPDKVRLLYVETPANPSNAIVDIAAVTKLGRDLSANRERRVLAAVDNTFLGPVFQRPADFGADLVLYSATKFIGGHSDLVAGVVTGPGELMEGVMALRTIFGTMATPFSGWLLLRSLETLSIRMRRQAKSATKLAELLSEQPKVRRVFYPGLLPEGHPQREIYDTQCTGPGSLVSFEVDGGEDEAFRVLDAFEVFRLAVSLGGTESLVEHPMSMTHADVAPEQLASFDVSPGMIRMSVGLEHLSDLKRDILGALETLG